MYIELDKLARALQKHASINVYNVSNQIIRNIQMFPLDFDPAEHTLDSEICYVCDFRKLRYYDPLIKFPPLICVMEPNSINEGLYFGTQTVISVFGLTMADLMATLVGITYDLGGRSTPLQELSYDLAHCCGIRELLDKGVSILGNPIIVTDSSLKIVASADSGSISNTMFGELTALGYLPAGHPCCQDNENLLSQQDHPFVSEQFGDIPSVMVKALKSGNRTVGYLNVFQFDREFSEDDTAIANLLGNLLAVELRNYSELVALNDRDHIIERFFQDMIENDRDPDYIEKEKSKLGISLKQHLTVFVMYFRSPKKLPAISYPELAQTIAQNIPNTYGFVFRRSIMLICGTDKVNQSGTNFLEPVMDLMEKYDLIAGMSNTFHDLRMLRAHSFQCCKAIQLGKGLHPEKRIYSYRDYFVYYMAEICLKNNDITAFFPPEVGQLIEINRSENKDILETLQVYLRCGRSKTQTAREMFLHLNTVKYRLQQFQNLSGWDINNDENALKLLLSFKFLEYQEKLGSFEPADFLSRELL